MRVLGPILSLVVLAACVPPEPPLASEQGVGFENYPEYQRRVAAESRANMQTAPQGVATYTSPYPGMPASTTVPLPEMAGGTPGSGTGAPTAAELAQAGVSGAAALAPGGEMQAGVAPVAVYPQTAAVPMDGMAPVDPAAIPDHAGISDEQDFSAVASRETIQSDKQRIDAAKANYQQVAPAAVPERPAANEVSPIIQYAITAPNTLGQKVYDRSGNPERSAKACLNYTTSESAQEAFLKAGGPKRDSKNLDPDGDGFACTWDPTPFQKARG